MVLSIGFAVDSSAPDRDDCRLEYSLYNQYYRYGAYHLLQILSLRDDSRLYFGYFQYYMVYVLFTFHSLMAAVIILALQSLLSAAIFIMLIKEDCISMIFWQVNLVWYIYLMCLIAGVVF